ncbi:MAG TPA: hypothetical protein VMV84_06505 [Dehalococcoidales bacterium]|nr:hypothetical protein [Dehalococcoidales bacterium]
MDIEGAEISISRSSLLRVGAPDKIRSCIIKIKDSKIGVTHPIILESGGVFLKNIIHSEIPSPILLDETSGSDFSGVSGNLLNEAAWGTN